MDAMLSLFPKNPQKIKLWRDSPTNEHPLRGCLKISSHVRFCHSGSSLNPLESGFWKHIMEKKWVRYGPVADRQSSHAPDMSIGRQKDKNEAEALHRNNGNQLLDREDEQKSNCCRAVSPHQRMVGASTNGLRFGSIGAGLRGGSSGRSRSSQTEAGLYFGYGFTAYFSRGCNSGRSPRK